MWVFFFFESSARVLFPVFLLAYSTEIRYFLGERHRLGRRMAKGNTNFDPYLENVDLNSKDKGVLKNERTKATVAIVKAPLRSGASAFWPVGRYE